MAGADVAIVMGSDSDWPTLYPAKEVLDSFGISHTVEVVSAHRTPEKMIDFAKDARANGYKIIIAAAGGAAHLPGMIASVTTLPVIGVPVPLSTLDGLDSLLSIVQMPPGIPVATVSIAGAKNAGLLAARILGANDKDLAEKLDTYQADLKVMVAEKNEKLQSGIAEGLIPGDKN
ncbi:MAG: 5-(carboxyamino)imidazole ribonucleotide mutase [Microbacteriaceae bacterium]|nr:5-(carboxyamino)imidazole ribonucleotide mutase [Microbacteriaceae bacterium]